MVAHYDASSLISFLSTPSARRATPVGDALPVVPSISIHALREEGDGPSRSFLPGCRYFYPRPPRGGRRGSLTAFLSLFIFLSTPSARRATPDIGGGIQDFTISIHALREEGDPPQFPLLLSFFDFYPRPPRGGRQQKQRQNLYFQTNCTTFCTNLEEP